MRNLLQNPNPNASLILLAASTRSPLRLYSSDSNDSSIDQDLPASASESTQEKDASLDVQDVGNKDLRNKLAWILEDAIIKYGLARDGESDGESDDESDGESDGESDYQANYQSDGERWVYRSQKQMLCDLVRRGHIRNPAEKWLRDAVRRGHLDIHEIPEPGDYELVDESDDEDKDYQSTGK